MLRRLLPAGALACLAVAGLTQSPAAFVPREPGAGPATASLEIPLPGRYTRADARLAPSDDSRIADFAARTGGRWSVDWNERTGTPHLVIGTGAPFRPAGIRGEEEARTAALDIVASNADLFGAAPQDLEIVSVESGLGKWVVHFQQNVKGVPVEGAYARVAFTNAGRLVLLGSDAHAVGTPVTVASISREDAVNRAVLPVGYDASGDAVRSAELVLLPIPGGEAEMDYRLAWRVRASIDSPPGNWRVYIDARSGDVIARENLIRTATVTGSVKADVQFSGYCDGTTPGLPLDDNRVTVAGQGAAITDAAGNWSLTTTGSGPFTVRDSLRGPFCRVTVFGAPPDAAFSGSVSEGSPLHVVWSDGNSRRDERDCFYNANLVHAQVKAIDPAFTDLDYAMLTTVARTDGYCPGNAWWDGSGINFCTATTTYANTGEIGNVVFHEYGHGLTQEVYLPMSEPDSDLHEGNSDVLACYFDDESIVGLGFFVGNCTGGIRNLDNSLRWPEDASGGGHFAGQIIGGFHWDAREYLRTALPQAEADSIAWNTWHFARRLGKPYSQPDQVVWTFVMDDDDGNLDNGTPHYDAFCAAAANHGFESPGAPGPVAIDHLPLATTTDPSRVHEVESVITSSAASIDLGASHLSYRAGGGAFTDLPLTHEGGDVYSAVIPFVPQGSEVEYFIYARDTGGNEITNPGGCVTGLHAFDVAYAYDNLEAASGWTVGAPGDLATSGVWTRVDPVGTAAQPEDDHTPAPGTTCFVTGQGLPGGGLGDNDVDGGATTLTSPVYDLSGGSDIAVKYFRWYTNDTGAEPGQDFWKVDISNTGGTSWTGVENTTDSDHFWKPVRATLSEYFPVPGQVRLRFIATDAAPGSLVEAGIDDFEVLANFGTGTAVQATGREPGLPVRFALGSAQPNPSRPRTVINYDLPRESRVSLRIFDVEGREVRALVATTQPAGKYGVAWDGRDGQGSAVASGVYYYRLDAGEFSATEKVVLTR